MLKQELSCLEMSRQNSAQFYNLRAHYSKIAKATIIKFHKERPLIETMDQHLNSREKTFDLWITNHFVLRHSNEE
jgi:hypothetical protein